MKKFILIAASLLLTLILTLRLIPYPELTQLQNQSYSSQIYDRNGRLVQITVLENGLRREFTPINDIPQNVKKIIIKAEDKRFYFHHGVDYIAAVKALFQNLSAKKTVRGASTITMQLAKIISPSTEHSFSKKLLDIFSAYRIELKLSKKEILELYLNSLPFGMNTEGITSAARTFYGAELTELSDEKICCLATIPRYPNFYNPIKNPDECAKKAFIIAKNFKSNADYSKIEEAAHSSKAYKYPFNMPHYIFYLQKNDFQGCQCFYPNKRRSKISQNKTPYKVILKADLELQNAAEDYMMQALELTKNSRISNGSLLLLDNSDGSVLAWLGNGSWFDTENKGQIDGVLVKNQPGSSMKPFLYALALEEKDENGKNLYYPSKILADIPSEFGKEKLYIPSNFNNRFNGPIRFRIALASSLNIPAVSLLNEIGVDNYLNKLYELGFDSLKERGREADLGLALGAGEVTLQELVRAFAVFTRDGKEFNGTQIYSSDTARLICSILSDKGARALGFGYSQTFETDYPSIFKTGTSNQYQDIVALGSTKNFTIGVWMGNFSGETVMGKTGSSLPAWVAKKILDLLEKGSENSDYKIDYLTNRFTKEDLDFPTPEGWTKKRICSLSGMAASPDCPACVYEYVQNGVKLSECNWHKKGKNSTEIIYPAEYQKWARQYNLNAKINYSSAPLSLLSPNDNSLFYYSRLYSEKQAIPVEFSGGYSDELTIFYDDTLYKKIGRPFVFSLPVERGSHTCSVECGQQIINFNFIVK
ncbi:MAG: transglycosylase domain-containing protein [Treponema sp.]|nr:transglycosylase domain-containing protein [Treponema sp.]